MMEHPEISGLYNLGTGQARTFCDLGNAVFSALEMPPNIEYVEMPEGLRQKYQYFTEASVDKLREVGYAQPFYTLEDGVKDYVQNYLEQEFAAY